MRSIRKRFDRFCFKHRDKGIPNLMLYIVLGTALVSIMSMFNGGAQLYSLLCFDKASILHGQVWRLFTFVFTEGAGGGFLELIFLYFFYNLGRHVEQSMGTLRFNLYYFTGVIFMDIFAMIFCPTEAVIIGEYLVSPEFFVSLYSQMAFYLHLSLLLSFAVLHPDAQFLIFFIIPIKAWVMGIVYLVIMFANVFNMSYPVNLFPHNLFPFIGLANFLLFAGKDIFNLLPFTLRAKLQLKRKKATQTAGPKVVTFRTAKDTANSQPYIHLCTVCGRTDVSNPELEFRYCSRCNGYHCYCEDHINNHTHVE